jgi:tRNA dimethylallyltransferase
MEPIPIIIGPTAAGKTMAGMEAAEALGGEIVSADSRLVYRLMDIGTAKPSIEMRSRIPHHLIDVVMPDEEYTSKRYEREARAAVRDISSRGRLPLVVGGSGLYVRALTHGIFEGPSADPALRGRLRAEGEREGGTALWERLREVDPCKAAQIDPGNLSRVIRALEVHEITGRKMSDLEKEAEPLSLPYRMVGLSLPRAELYRRIEERVDRMMAEGFLQEVRGLVDAGYGEAPAVRNTLGYKELLDYLAQPEDGTGKGGRLDTVVDQIKKNTRNFAKRQLTWFRKDKEVTWFTSPAELIGALTT